MKALLLALRRGIFVSPGAGGYWLAIKFCKYLVAQARSDRIRVDPLVTGHRSIKAQQRLTDQRLR